MTPKANPAYVRCTPAAQELPSYCTCLEQIVAERTVQLEKAVAAQAAAHAALHLAQAQAIQAEKLAGLGQLIAGVAHEINNPLGYVATNVAILRRDLAGLREVFNLYRQADPLLAEKNAELYRQIHELCERLEMEHTLEEIDGTLLRSKEGLARIGQIVRDLSTFVRGDEQQPQEVELQAGLEATVNIVRGRALHKAVRIKQEIALLPPLKCFAGKINQVVLNLLTNAIDACVEAGKVTLRAVADAREVRIEVEDDGHGIDPAILPHIFDPFFTTKPPGQGLGLGLSISQRIIHEHGGTIEVRPITGQGVCFVVHLPLHPAAN